MTTIKLDRTRTGSGKGDRENRCSKKEEERICFFVFCLFLCEKLEDTKSMPSIGMCKAGSKISMVPHDEGYPA